MSDTYKEQTIAEYLSGTVAIEIPDRVIATVLTKSGMDGDELVSSYDEKQKDLAEAELLYSLITLPSRTATVRDADGNWSHQEGGATLTENDKKILWMRANALRSKWDMDAFPYYKGTITMTTFGIASNPNDGFRKLYE